LAAVLLTLGVPAGVTTGVITLAGNSVAQTIDLAGSANKPGFHQPGARRNMILHGEHLFAVVIQRDGAVQIRRKVNDTTSGWATLVSAVNTENTGIGTRPTTSVAMCVTGSGCLHITWGRYYYPGYFHQYYRAYKIGTGFAHTTPQDITAMVGATTRVRTDSNAIATGRDDEVYMTAQIPGKGWQSQLLQSQFTGCPDAKTAPRWAKRGAISANGSSSSNVRMAVDTGGRVQLSFYNNSGRGRYATRVFSSPGTWSAMAFIGNPISSPGHDESGYLATDFSDYTHVIYRHMVSKVGSLVTYQLLYRRRYATNAWSAPIVVDTFTNRAAGSNNTRDGFAISASLKGDRVFAIHRDYSSGRLMVKQKKFGDPGFTRLACLQPASSADSDYYMPCVRNTLYPIRAGRARFLDISFRRRVGSSYRLYHQRLDVGTIGR
ncbi:MAG: hypothetical protein VB934_08010, partial [Polyangiaceae bacterium]